MTNLSTELLILVCGGADSCTKNTNYAVRPWLGNGKVFTVVDTPGFGDSDQVNV
jgi:hypothetical protein